jgi:isochorismate synthase
MEMAPYEEWRARIEAIREALRAGVCQKIVAARQVRLRWSEAPDPLAVFGALQSEYPGCNVFLVRHGEGTFVGATPENLFLKCGEELVTHALAGSFPTGAAGQEGRSRAALLGSEKNRWEHRVVVDRITEALGAFSVSVRHPAVPEVVRVRDLLHLDTPVQATLRPGVHAADLVDALHPTPAVGGLPQQEAVEWITSHESEPRGWYTGILGWVDASGDADLAVAIRCGLLRGDQVVLFAGAGVVGESTPEGEWEETALKLRPMLRALGALVEEPARPASPATYGPPAGGHGVALGVEWAP